MKKSENKNLDEVLEVLNEEMQEGYDTELEKIEIWGSILPTFWELIEEYKITTVDEADITFGMFQCFSNWIQDFEIELEMASKKDGLFLQQRLDLCETYIKHFSMEKGLILENMIRGKAECYFLLGEHQKGEEIFQKELEKDPKWGWGWIGWAQIYWWILPDKQRDLDRAHKIFQKAFEIKGLRDLDDVNLCYNDLLRHMQTSKVILEDQKNISKSGVM